MPETWYVLEDDTAADPRDVKPNAKGILTHKDGRKVAYAPHGPRSRSVDPDEERAKKTGLKSKPEAKDGNVAELPASAQAEPADKEAKQALDPDGNPPSLDAPAIETRDMSAGKPKRTYKTRESKAD